jgi:hypothetical protein
MAKTMTMAATIAIVIGSIATCMNHSQLYFRQFNVSKCQEVHRHAESSHEPVSYKLALSHASLGVHRGSPERTYDVYDVFIITHKTL